MILTEKAATVVKTQTWSHPTVEDESRYVEQQGSSTVDDEIRQDHEAAEVSKLTSSQEHMLSPAAATSPRVDESVEHTINQSVEEHRVLPGDVSEIQLGSSSDEPIVMDRISSISSRIHNSKTKLQKKKNVLKKLVTSMACKMKSKESGHLPTTQEKSVVKGDSSVALSIKPSGSITAVENPGLDVARTASTSLMDKDDEDDAVIAAEHLDEEVPEAKLPTELGVDVAKTASSSLMNKDDEDETDVVAEHLDEEVPKEKERKPLNSLANLLTLGVCSVKPDTSSAEFKIDHVESDGYDGGSENTSEDEPAPKGLFSCGAAAPTSPRKGIFDGLTTAQSDAAVGVTTDIDDEEVKALTSQANLLSIGEENITEVQANGSEGSQPQQQPVSVSSIPSISEESEIKLKDEKPQHIISLRKLGKIAFKLPRLHSVFIRIKWGIL